MMLKMLHSKIHRARVTHADLHYEGSLGIDRGLMEKVGLIPGQQIDVVSVANGARFTTYAIPEESGSGKIGVYGAAAHLAKAGDIVIIIAYALMDEREAKSYKPKVIVLDAKNQAVKNG